MISPVSPDPLISTSWLADRLGERDLRVFDCTTELLPAAPEASVPYHPRGARERYQQGHLPGAGFLDLPGSLSARSTGLQLMMPPEDQFAAAMEESGIGEGVFVALYSAGSMMWATRMWWMLRAMGFNHAAVLDGGLEKWVAEGRPLDQGACVYPRAHFVARPRAGLIVDREAVVQAIGDPDICLLHTLGVDAFRGEGPSRYGRPGRIPGSVNLPYSELIDPGDGSFIDLEQGMQRLRAVGADIERRVLAYCGGGISATLALFFLHRLGHRDLGLYDGSLGEWARDPDLPIERG